MALAPLSQTVILTEDGSVVLATTQVTIPPRIPTLTNTFGTSQIPINQVVGGVAAFDALDEQLQRLGL